MKNLLLSAVLLITVRATQAQLILSQDFSSSTLGWLTANGSSIGTYNNAGNGCAVEYGIITPGVGGNNPAKVLSEVVTPNQPLVEVKFNIARYDASLTCNSQSNFGCATSVDIIAVASTYNGINPIGDGAVIYSNYSGFLLPIAGGAVSIIVSLPVNKPAFKVFFSFSTSSCNQPGTKYILDKFYFTGVQPCQIANTCAPVANNDYFNAGAQGFTATTLLGNVYGTNIFYTPTLAHIAYVTRSLTHAVIAPLGGNDADVDNTPLVQMTFTLLSKTFTATDANFTFNNDGTFSFLRLNQNINQFFFTYRLTDAAGLYDDAIVRIDYAPGGALPVSLVDFAANKTSTGVLLNWKTLQEINNKGFEVLRKTTGDYEKITFVESKALNHNSTALLSYSYKDISLPAGNKVIYYRLLQVDLNGRESYSDIQVINNNINKQPLLIYPNPSRGSLRIIIPSAITSQSTVQIVDAAGAVVKQKNTTEQYITIEGLRPGIYWVKVNTIAGNNQYSEKIIVQ